MSEILSIAYNIRGLHLTTLAEQAAEEWKRVACMLLWQCSCDVEFSCPEHLSSCCGDHIAEANNVSV